MQLLQGQSGLLLRRVGHKAVFQRLLQGLEGSRGMNKEGHGRLCSPRSADNATVWIVSRPRLIWSGNSDLPGRGTPGRVEFPLDTDARGGPDLSPPARGS